MTKINLIKTLKGYTYGWVSISKDYKKVIARGKTLQNLLKKLSKMGNPKGYLMRAEKDFSRYVGA